MKRKILTLLFVFMWLMAACKPSASTQAPPTEAPTVAPTSSMQSTTAPVVSQPGCTVTSRTANSEPEGESPIPAVGEQDWVIGSPDAYVTIIEYGDFQ